MTRITEYVGKEGVISSTWGHDRAAKPRAGDLIRWSTGEIGRVEQVGGQWGDDKAHVCYSLGSAFLGIIMPKDRDDLTEAQQERMDGYLERTQMHFAKVYVSISGGPFRVIPLSDFKCTYELHLSPMWNWGDNLAGADMGVQYGLYRPLFNVNQPKPSS